MTQRKRKDGSSGFTAQIRITKEGKVVYQESQTFDRKATAQAWIRKREAELYEPGAVEKANRKGVTVKQMIDRYLVEYEKLRPLGKTKRATLKAIGESWLGEVEDQQLTSQKLVDYAMDRIEKDGIQPQTVGNDLAHLGAVLSVARPAWGYEVDPLAMPDARRVLKKLGAVTKSVERNRRPTRDELERIIKYFQKVRDARRQEIDMVRVVVFALFSTRRQEEITRIRWDALNDQEQSALITDMKNPGQKYGNDVWCHMPDEAWRILQSMPRVADEVLASHAFGPLICCHRHKNESTALGEGQSQPHGSLFPQFVQPPSMIPSARARSSVMSCSCSTRTSVTSSRMRLSRRRM
nr:site-specific integrase [Pseudomonas sp. Marseille-Q3773]